MKSGFTLAEILITLGIIGIVAALTIPTVVKNIQHRELQTGFKEAYSSINQALKLYHAENGIPLIPDNKSSHALKPTLMQYFRTAKDCGWGHLDANRDSCIPNPVSWTEEQKKSYKSTYKTYNDKVAVSMWAFDDGQFIINNGMLILLEDATANLDKFISVDVNGYDRKPNKLGHDLFMFQINKDDGHLMPMGAKGTTYYSTTDAYCSKSSTSSMNGAGCTVKALNDKDYFKNLP